MNRFFKKTVAVALSAVMLAGTGAMAVSAAPADYTITSPYETVDWDTWGHYKTQLHSHTLYSDGEMDITDVVEAYYAQGYDVLAITDHGVVNQGWNKVPEMIPLIGYNQYIKDLQPMDEARYQEITQGTDRNGRGMLDVNYGIEMNAVVVRKNHVNGYFCGWGQSFWGNEEDYETPVAETEKAGGISVINHPGDFFNAAADASRAAEPENLKYFTDVFMKYPSCVGFEVFNRVDTTDRADRIVWDNVLMYTVPRGRMVWGFSNDDSHVLTDIGLTAEIMMMPENTNDALRTAMENGTFFACAEIARNEMGEDFRGNGNYAVVNRISVDEERDIITVDAENADVIEWISNGVIIAEGESFSLRDHADELGSYVRFQIKNEGGLLLSQPFVCDDGDMQRHIIDYPEDKIESLPHFFRAILRFLEILRKSILGETIYKMLFL